MVCDCVQLVYACAHVCEGVCLCMSTKHTCNEKARRAGMGTRAAMKNAIMLLMEVRATLVPVRRRQSPVRSFTKKPPRRHKSEERKKEERTREERRRGFERYLEGYVAFSFCEGVSQQKHIIHTDPQCQEGKHLE